MLPSGGGGRWIAAEQAVAMGQVNRGRKSRGIQGTTYFVLVELDGSLRNSKDISNL